jgi:peptidyl-prolyl cis-trans isomerase C
LHTKLKLITGVAALAILVGGCQKKAGGQVVAVVNGEEITQQELNGELQGAMIPPSADKKAVMAQLLQRVIDRKLLVQKAKAEGLDQSPAYLDQVRRADEALMVNLLASKAAKGIALPDGASVDRFIATNATLFNARKRYTLDQIVFAQPADMSIVRQLEPAHSLDAVAATLSASGIAFTRGTATLDSATIQPAMAAKIAALPPGEPFVTPDSGRLVASVIKSTESTPTPEQQAKPAALNLLRQQALAATMQKQVETARAAAKIDYQAGFAPPPKAASRT